MRMMIALCAVVVLLSGCGQQAPITSHGKPVSHWLDAMKSPNPTVRKEAVTALGHVGTADPAALPALIKAVEDSDARIRAEAVLALLNIGPPAKEALPALEKARKDRDKKVQRYAARAIERIEGK